jgi:stress response protein YsnF
MLSERELSAAIGSTAYGPDGQKIGTVESFYVDDRTGAPSWVAVATGLFGTRHSIVPAVDATFADGNLRLPVDAAAVKSAPHMAGDHLDPAEEEALRRHYGLATAAAAPTSQPAPVAEPTAEPTGVAGPTTEPAGAAGPRADEVPAESAAEAAERSAGRHRDVSDGGMTRSEEQLRVGTERVAATRVRLVKYVVTEDVQITVPIRREEIRVEEVPVDALDPGPGESLVPAEDTAGERAGSPGLPEEIILHTERPVVTVEVVPTERVRLRTEQVQGQETVTGQVQREQVVVDQSAPGGAGPDEQRRPPVSGVSPR